MRWGRGRALAAVLCWFGVVPALQAQAQPPAPSIVAAGFGPQAASPEAVALGHWVRESGNAAGRPYAIVDKRQARLYVFDAQGRLAGATAALLGSTPGDHKIGRASCRERVL